MQRALKLSFSAIRRNIFQLGRLVFSCFVAWLSIHSAACVARLVGMDAEEENQVDLVPNEGSVAADNGLPDDVMGEEEEEEEVEAEPSNANPDQNGISDLRLSAQAASAYFSSQNVPSSAAASRPSLPSDVEPDALPVVLAQITRTSADDSHDDDDAVALLPFKKRKIDPPEPVAVEPEKRPPPDEDVDDSADDCLICFDSITVSGDHRAVCLRCGHIFGQACIIKWLSTSDKDKRNCPQCKMAARTTDVRILFCKRTIRVLDNSHVDQLKKDLSSTQMTLAEIREKHTFSEMRLKMEKDSKERLAREKADLEHLVAEYRSQLGAPDRERTAISSQESSRPPSQPRRPIKVIAGVSSSSKTRSTNLVLSSVLDFGGHSARVMAHYPREKMMVISHRGDFGPFKSGAALKLVSCLDFKTSELVPLSCGDIKDVAVNNQTGTALIASINNSITLFSLHNKAIVHTYREEAPVWSCTWNSEQSSYLYCGLGSGLVSVFDVRKLSERVQTLRDHLPANLSRGKPVHQLTHLPRNAGHSFPLGGLLLSSLDRTGFYNCRDPGMANNTWEYTTLVQTGGLQYASAFDKQTRFLGTSLRPRSCAGQTKVAHSIAQLNYQSDASPKVSAGEIHQVQAGSMSVQMLRSSFITLGGDGNTQQGQLLFAAPDESSKNVLIWDLVDKKPKQELRVNQVVYDMCSVSGGANGSLLALTLEKSLQLYTTA